MLIKEQTKNTIIIVSGLPRSGTSMMMQLLKAGGVELLTDNIRKNDESNPKGYYELEAVKSMATDVSFIDNATGKCVKIISQLLHYLPNTYNYKIIFMQRDVYEVLKSQQKMLGKNTSIISDSLAEIFSKQTVQAQNWLSKQSNIETLYIHYKKIIDEPEVEIKKIISFLNLELKAEKMKEVVDKNLYRNKI